MEVKMNSYGTSAIVNGTPYYIRDGVVWRSDGHHYDGYRNYAYDQMGFGPRFKCHFKNRDEARRFLIEARAVFKSWRMGKAFQAF